jgi:uncharacterized tellurite resistance protein B-like protein
MKTRNTSVDRAPVEELNVKQFYKKLGELLYAIAYADGIVRKKEFETLRTFVLKELAPSESSYDSSGMNKAFYAEFTFEALNGSNTMALEAFQDFIDYLRINSKLINRPHREMILHAVRKVATAYKRINKKEQEMIQRLTAELGL